MKYGELVAPLKKFVDDQVSISIHAYGGDIGEVDRDVFPKDGQSMKRFRPGYSNLSE